MQVRIVEKKREKKRTKDRRKEDNKLKQKVIRISEEHVTVRIG